MDTTTLELTMGKSEAYDGLPAKVITLTNRIGMQVAFMDIGATWLSCLVPVQERKREVLLGVTNMTDFDKQSSYMGVTVGRYANRIANGQFEVDDKAYQVLTNQAGNALHGGPNGFDKRRWQVEAQSETHVVFTLNSEDGDQGFPGNLTVSVRYEITDDNDVTIRYFAQTDKATVVNLTNHGYFNLLGAESGFDCLDHILSVNSAQYLPTTEVGIPLGELESVDGTGFDFREPKVISQQFMQDEQQVPARGFDHSYLLNTDTQSGTCAATVTSPDSLITLKLYTDKPAMQLYTGNWLEGTPNRQDGEYVAHAGVALETQFLPDSPNHPEWPQPSCILQPSEEYSFYTRYQFVV